MRDLWSGHAPQALVVVLGLLGPLTGRKHHDRGVRGTDTHVRDRRQPRERRAQLGLARLRGVAGPGDLADARRVVVLGARGQAALPPFCSAVLGRRRHRICGAPLHGLRGPLPRWWALASVACGQPVVCLAGARSALQEVLYL